MHDYISDIGGLLYRIVILEILGRLDGVGRGRAGCRFRLIIAYVNLYPLLLYYD